MTVTKDYEIVSIGFITQYIMKMTAIKSVIELLKIAISLQIQFLVGV